MQGGGGGGGSGEPTLLSPPSAVLAEHNQAIISPNLWQNSHSRALSLLLIRINENWVQQEQLSLIDIWMHFSCVSPPTWSPLYYILMVVTAEHKYRIEQPALSHQSSWQHTCIPVLLMSHGQGSALETFSHTNTQSENLHKSILPIFCWKQQPTSQLS